MSSVEEYAGAVVQYYDGTVERCVSSVEQFGAVKLS